MEYEFTVIFAIDKCGKSTAEIVELLGESGFTDTLIGLGRPGHVAIQFCREGASHAIAAQAAIAAVKKVLPKVELVEVRHQDNDDA
jgi:hypothetical protein